MSQGEPKKIHPFFEKVRQASNQPHVIVPQIIPSSECQHGSEAEQTRSQRRKRKRKLITESKGSEDTTHNDVSSTENLSGSSPTPTASEDEPVPRRSKRLKGANSSLPPSRPESIADQETDTSCQLDQLPAASGHRRIELADDGDGASRVSSSENVHSTSTIPTCYNSAPESETVDEKFHTEDTGASSPPRKLIKLHLSGRLLSSPTRRSRLPSPPDLPPEESMEKQSMPPMFQQQKTLRINQNGKLLSSPPPSVQEDSLSDTLDKKKLQRPIPRRKKEGRSRGVQRGSLVVNLRYGVNDTTRQEIGQKIEAIMQGTPYNITHAASPSADANPTGTNNPSLEAVQPVPPPQPPKPLHPFFLPKQAHAPPTTMLDGNDKPISAQTNIPPTLQTDNSLPANPTKPFESKVKFPPVKSIGTWPIVRSKKPRYPEAKHALWPSQGCMHARGINYGEMPTFHDLHFKSMKGKRARNRVDSHENVLTVISKCLRELHLEHGSRSRSPLRRPKQQHWTGVELERVVGNRLTTLHSAVIDRREDIKGATNAFERGTCEDNLWTAKYAPSSTEEVLQDNNDISILSEWLKALMVYTVQKEAVLNAKAGKQGGNDAKKQKKRKKKKRKAKSDLDDFIAPDDSEEEEPGDVQFMLNNLDGSEDELGLPITTLPKKIPVGPPKKAILVTGPTGCGKTASVYAAAKEVGFEVFEMNAGSKRSGRDILERVGDMARNHLVQLEKQLDGAAAKEKGNSQSSSAAPASDPTKQKTMGSFFKASTSSEEQQQMQLDSTSRSSQNDELQEVDSSQSRAPTKRQKQSLILLDDADILFEEDKQFWTGVLALLEHSKRPIIMTCTSELSIPLEELNLEAVVHMTPPSPETVADYCLAIAAQEGHLLKHEDVESLYLSLGKDLRATVTMLNFWCQMGIGSEKSGLDWRPDSRMIFGKEEEKHEVPRTISDGGYLQGQEGLNHDVFILPEQLERELALREEYLMQWSVGVMDWEEDQLLAELRQNESSDPMQVDSTISDIENHLRMSEMRSCLDIFCGQSSETPLHDKLDASWPEISQKQRYSYTEAYPLVQADPEVEFSSLTTRIGSAFSVFLDHLNPETNEPEEQSIMDHIKYKIASPLHATLDRKSLYSILEPICQEDLTMHNSASRRLSSLDREVPVTAEDIAPYIRLIVNYDEERIRRCEEFLREDAENNVKRRMTRSSMAAADSDGTSSRRENYITRHNELIPAIYGTAGPSWRRVLEEYMSKSPPVTEIPIYERDWVFVNQTPADYQDMQPETSSS